MDNVGEYVQQQARRGATTWDSGEAGNSIRNFDDQFQYSQSTRGRAAGDYSTILEGASD